MLILNTRLLVFGYISWRSFEGCLPTYATGKSLVPQTNKRENPIKSTHACFPITQPYPKHRSTLMHMHISEKVSRCLFLSINPCKLKNVKENIFNKNTPTLKAWSSLLQWIMCFPKTSKIHRRLKIWRILSIGNNIIRSWCIRIVRHSTYGLCCPSPSKWIVRRKSRECALVDKQKMFLCLLTMSNFTFISWTVLSKRTITRSNVPLYERFHKKPPFYD